MHYVFQPFLRVTLINFETSRDATTYFVRDRNSLNSLKISRKPSTPTLKRNVELIPMSLPSSQCMPITESKKNMSRG